MHWSAMGQGDLAAGDAWELQEAAVSTSVQKLSSCCLHGNHGACLPKDDTVRFKTRFYLDLKFRLPIMVSQSRGKFAIDFKGDKLSLLIVYTCVL